MSILKCFKFSEMTTGMKRILEVYAIIFIIMIVSSIIATKNHFECSHSDISTEKLFLITKGRCIGVSQATNFIINRIPLNIKYNDALMDSLNDVAIRECYEIAGVPYLDE